MNYAHQAFRVLGVIPGLDDALSMPFARREMVAVGTRDLESCTFFLRSRTNPFVILKETLRLRKMLREFHPDVVHAQYGTMTALVCILASPVPVVITFQGQDLNPSPGVSWPRLKLGHALSHFAAKRAAQIICVSPGLRERIAYIQDRVHVVPSGIKLGLFQPLPMNKCRAELGWATDEKVVAFNAGSDPIRKRIDLALAAIELAKSHIPKLRLHVFDGNTHPDKMPLYLNAADCLLVASDYEGSPNVVKEALACNLPIVSVDVGDVVERLSGVSPSAIAERNPVALGEALVAVIRQNRRSNGREMMPTLSAENVAEKVAAIYRLAAESKPSSAIRQQAVA